MSSIVNSVFSDIDTDMRLSLIEADWTHEYGSIREG